MSGFGWAGAGAAGSDALQEMLAQKRATYLGNQDMLLKQAQSARADQELALQRQQAIASQAERAREAKIQEAGIAVSQATPGQELTPDVVSQVQGTPYASRLNTQQSLPSSTIPMKTDVSDTSMMPAQTTAPKIITTLRPTQAQEKQQGQDTARRQVVELFKRGAPKNELLGALADAGENIPATELLKDPNEKFNDFQQQWDYENKHPHPQSAAQADALERVEHKDPDTGKTVIEWLPKSTLRGQKFDAPDSATVANRTATAKVLQQVGGDIVTQLRDPNTAKLLGPALGRYNSVQDFIGNPPPEFAKLAGRIESYALANPGMHGMRSAEAAQQIKAMLASKKTPEAIAAAIEGLNDFSDHFLDNEGIKPAGGSSFRVVGTRPAGQ